jgi:hypothetical protein
MPQLPDLNDKKDIDKVSFAGIFNKLFHPLTLPLSPNLGERGRVRGNL